MGVDIQAVNVKRAFQTCERLFVVRFVLVSPMQGGTKHLGWEWQGCLIPEY
jgi:hypothetical protein